jgi:hypothetical protein
LAFARGADGDEAPVATIAGSSTRLAWPVGVALDGKGQLYVLDKGNPQGQVVTPFIAVDAVGPNGNVPPIAKIAGPQTGLVSPAPDGFAVDRAGAIYIVELGRILIFPPGANGNVAPQRTVSSSSWLYNPTDIRRLGG